MGELQCRTTGKKGGREGGREGGVGTDLLIDVFEFLSLDHAEAGDNVLDGRHAYFFELDLEGGKEGGKEGGREGKREGGREGKHGMVDAKGREGGTYIDVVLEAAEFEPLGFGVNDD